MLPTKSKCRMGVASVMTPQLRPITSKLGSTPRLNALASFVPKATRVFVDVGTNHAILPILVARRTHAKLSIGIDRSPQALLEAERRVRRSHCARRIELRLGDGLSDLASNEVEVICLAGLAPVNMVKILTGGLAVMQGHAVRLLLHPLGSSEQPRAFLAANDFELVVDTTVMSRGRDCTLLVAERQA